MPPSSRRSSCRIATSRRVSCRTRPSACWIRARARVAISQSATPATVADTRAAIAAREEEKAALAADADLGVAADERIGEIDARCRRAEGEA